MKVDEAIEQLQSLKLDRESFCEGEKEHDEIYLKDIEAIETVLKELKEKDKQIRKLKKQAKLSAKENMEMFEFEEKVIELLSKSFTEEFPYSKFNNAREVEMFFRKKASVVIK